MHHKASGKLSDYGVQLREKQKARRVYGMLERQFRSFFQKAVKKRGITGETLIQMLERRLDNVVYRSSIVSSRPEARQMVQHRLIKVNGRTVSIPSFQVRIGDVIEVRAKETVKKRAQENLEMLKDRLIPEWLGLDRENLQVKILRLPEKKDAGLPVEESQIVELYSK
jgi:small subunit ribosomal protein S4